MLPDIRRGEPRQPVAVKTRLVWAITGKYKFINNNMVSKAICHFLPAVDDSTSILKEFWELKEVPHSSTASVMTPEEKTVIIHFNQTQNLLSTARHEATKSSLESHAAKVPTDSCLAITNIVLTTTCRV